MDDLDDDLFGTLLKTQKNKSKIKSGVDELDDDDPLAGLLGLSDTEDDSKQKGSKSNKQQVAASGRASKPDAAMYDDSDAALILPDSPRSATRRPRSIMDDLLAKSDVVQRATQPTSVKQEFVLGENYRQSAGSENKKAEQFGYVPTASSSQMAFSGAGPGHKTASAIGNGENDEQRPVVSLPAGRTGRRGIPATIESTNSDDTLGIKRPLPTSTMSNPTPSGRGRRQPDSNWLELKNDSPSVRKEVTPQNEERTMDVVKPSNPNVGQQGRSRSTDKEIGGKIDWLGMDEPDEPQKSNKNNVTVDVSAEPKKESFLNWLDRAKPADPDLKSTQTANHGEPSGEVPRIKAVESAVRVPVPEFAPDVSGLTSDFEKRLSTFKTQMADAHLKFSEESLSAAANVFDLQTKVRRLEFDRDQLQRALEGLEKRHREELEALETSFKKRVQLTEESYQRREQRLQEELESVTKFQVEKQIIWDRDRAELLESWQRKLDESINDRMKDLDRLKDVHGRTLADMKRDHDVAIGRLQKIKNVELDAMNEATAHSKTLQLVIDQLRSNTTELSQLQLKVEGGHVSGLEEREMLLDTKDRQLRAVQEQLQKQREQNEQERTLLRELIARLEEKLQRQTVVQEEERWKLSQERNKLESEQNVFEESRKSTSIQFDREKIQLQKAKEQFLAEQKEVLQHVYSENQRMFSSGGESKSQSKFLANHLSPDVPNSFQSLKAQIEAEGTLKAIHEERERLNERMALLNSDKQFLDRQKLQLETERSAINALAVQVKQRSEEVEEMCLSAVQTREEGYASLQEAKQLRLEVRKRQEALTTQTEALKAKECQLAKERLILGRRRAELERLAATRVFCARCGANEASYSAAGGGPSSTSKTDDSVVVVRKLEPMFVAWQIAARKDQDFLNRESVFLRDLRANQRTNHTAPL